jgi:hypothetical protein
MSSTRTDFEGTIPFSEKEYWHRLSRQRSTNFPIKTTICACGRVNTATAVSQLRREQKAWAIAPGKLSHLLAGTTRTNKDWAEPLSQHLLPSPGKSARTGIITYITMGISLRSNNRVNFYTEPWISKFSVAISSNTHKITMVKMCLWITAWRV